MSRREPDLSAVTTALTVRGTDRADRSTGPSSTIAADALRARLVRRGLRLSYATIAYNSLEGVLALTFGLAAGSIALLGFGADRLIELTASGAAVWRLWADPVAALVMVPIIAREGVEGLRGRSACGDCCH